jgi:UDP-N-acetylglucosamine--N-acetylmuramyl-(pentapeptide) pyrophosphoryl-undecaprenol N-acetylglucosamine transferase
MVKKVLISGGGTGGHIFPALAIAKELERRDSTTEFLFVGASDRMEMDKVPAAGFKIIGLWISGFQRSISLKNILFPLKLKLSIIKSFFIVLRFKPDVVIGTGGFASGPILWIATLFKIPTLIQEQNSYPGITNKILSSRVGKICVAYPGLERFFPKDKIHITGNPIRSEIEYGHPSKEESLAAYGFTKHKTTVLVIGGSLGAKRINETILENSEWFKQNDIQLIWQTGKLYYDRCKLAQAKLGVNGQIRAFINDMSQAFAAADIVISRAGAIAISELSSLGKTCILIPSPNVAEDHQTKNALSLVDENAAVLVEEKNMKTTLFEQLELLVNNPEKQKQLAENCKGMDQPRAAEKIIDIIEELVNG